MDLHELQTTLAKGMRVKVCEYGKEVAEGTITEIVPGELELTMAGTGTKSREDKREYVYRKSWHGWKSTHGDPFTGARCTSEFAPSYLFKPIEETKK